jgi:hypothetical protein
MIFLSQSYYRQSRFTLPPPSSFYDPTQSHPFPLPFSFALTSASTAFLFRNEQSPSPSSPEPLAGSSSSLTSPTKRSSPPPSSVKSCLSSERPRRSTTSAGRGSTLRVRGGLEVSLGKSPYLSIELAEEHPGRKADWLDARVWTSRIEGTVSLV